MRKTVSLLSMLLLLNLSLGPLTCLRAAAAPATTLPQGGVLTNADVLMMLKLELSSEVIVAKIKVSNCKFDTSPSALEELKKAKASDAVILAMMEPPASNAAASNGAGAGPPPPPPRPSR